MNSTDPTKAVNLQELIADGLAGEISLDTTSYVNRIDDMIFPTSSVFDSYMDFIMPLAIDVNLNDTEYYKFKMRPKALSYFLYGTVELWALLLKLNRVQSTMDFDRRIVRVLDPKRLDVLNKVIIYNKDRLDRSLTAVLK